MINTDRIDIDDQTANLLEAIALHQDPSPYELVKLAKINPLTFREFIREVGLADDSDAVAILAATEAHVESGSLEGDILSTLAKVLPTFAQNVSASLLAPQLRWVPQAGGRRDINPRMPSLLPASCVVGDERCKIPGVQRMDLTSLTCGQDPVSDGRIRVEGDVVIFSPAENDRGDWKAIVATPVGHDPLDCPQDRIVFLAKWMRTPFPNADSPITLCVTGALLSAWQQVSKHQLSNSELSSWLYILLTHSEGLLNEAYPIVSSNVRDESASLVLEDLEPLRAAGHIDSMRYSLADQFEQESD